jgi:hypothetical protein
VKALSLKVPRQIQLKLNKFMEFYFEARYPEEQMEFYKKRTKKFAQHGLIEIREVFQWFKRKF